MSVLTKYVTLSLCCVLLVLIMDIFTVTYSTAQTPSFIRQNVKDAPLDWIDAVDQKRSASGDPSTDIAEVTYSSDGRMLNSTIWLLFPFKVMPTGYSILNYGMLIDSDYNENTGQRGIDYQLEIGWNNETKTWTKTLTEWAAAVSGRTLSKTENVSSFYGEHAYFVLLPLDLENIQYPSKFRVIYYAESKNDAGPLLTDFTKWINIPPPELQVATYPQSIELLQGESKTVELRINSTTSFEPNVMLSTRHQGSDPVLDFGNKKLKMPSYGSASIPLTVTTSRNTTIAPHTITIFTSSSYPDLDFVKMDLAAHNTKFPLKIQGEDRVVKTNILIDVKASLPLAEKVGQFWAKLGEPITFLYGALAGISPIIFKIVKKKLENKSIRSMPYIITQN